jgi:hypothetical protein
MLILIAVQLAKLTKSSSKILKLCSLFELLLAKTAYFLLQVFNLALVLLLGRLQALRMVEKVGVQALLFFLKGVDR